MLGVSPVRITKLTLWNFGSSNARYTVAVGIRDTAASGALLEISSTSSISSSSATDEGVGAEFLARTGRAIGLGAVSTARPVGLVGALEVDAER